MQTRPIKVLLVEDDQDDYVIVLDYICRMKEAQYQLDWICSYGDALDAVARREHDVCIFDYRLGIENGLDLLRAIRANGYSVPVLLLTRHPNRELEKMALDAGASGFLVKSEASATVLERAILHAIRVQPLPRIA